MKEGEYYRVYMKAKAALAKEPSYVLTWIMVECARKRRVPDKLLADSERLLAANSCGPTEVLHLRAIFYAQREIRRKRGMQQPEIGIWQRRTKAAPDRVKKYAEDELPALAAFMTSCTEEVDVRQQVAAKFVSNHPASFEGKLFLCRALIAGHASRVIEPGPEGKAGPLRPDRGKYAPRVDEALAMLREIEKVSPSHPLIAFYRATTLSFEAAYSDPAVVNVAELESAARTYAKEFLKSGSTYPRLAAATKSYLDSGKYWNFFPPVDA